MQRLTASQVESRQFRTGFGRKYGHYVTTLDLSDLCSNEEMDATIVVDALPSLPNINTVVTPNTVDVFKMVLDDAMCEGAADPLHCVGQAHFVLEALFELFASLPRLVVETSTVRDDFFANLAKKSPKTRRLVLYNDFNVEGHPTRLVHLALDALKRCPRITELKLRLTGNFEDAETFRDFVLPSECCLQHLTLSVFGTRTAALSELVGKLAPVLRSCELDFQEFSNTDNDGFPRGCHFPHLESLVATMSCSVATRGFASSVSEAAFPALRHLELRTRSPSGPLDASTLDKLAAAFGWRSVPPRIATDVVLEYLPFSRLDDLPLPAMNRPGGSRRSLVPSSIRHNPNEYRQSAVYPDTRHSDYSSFKSHAIDPILDRMRDMADEALEMTDYVQLTRIAGALQQCELLRIERDS